MTRATGVMVIAALALAVPMADGAAPAKRYKGTFAESGKLSFKVKKRNGNKKVVAFRFRKFPLECASGPQTTTDGLNFVMPVNDRNRFRGNGVIGNAGNPQSELTLRGKLRGARRATGTMRIEGSKVPIDAGGTDECGSPRTRWSAKRT